MQIDDHQLVRQLLVLFFLGYQSAGSAQEFSINVRSEHGEGVESYVFYTVESDRTPVGRTDEDGHLLPDAPCSTPEDILVEPTSPEYLPGKSHCRVTGGAAVVKVYNRQFTNRIVRTFERHAAEDNYAFEALLANELYVRYAASDSTAAEDYRNSIQPAVTEFLISTDLLPEGGVDIDTAMFETAVRRLQESRGLTVSGKLDYQTLSTAAGVDVGEVIATDEFHLDQATMQINDQM